MNIWQKIKELSNLTKKYQRRILMMKNEGLLKLLLIGSATQTIINMFLGFEIWMPLSITIFVLVSNIFYYELKNKQFMEV